MAVGVIDLLEVVDIAERHTQHFGAGPGEAVGIFKQGFERATVGQAGQVVLLGIAAGLVEAAAQRAGLGLAPQHLLFDIAGPAHHHLGDGRQFRDNFACFGDLLQLANVFFQRGMVLTGGTVSFAAGLGEFVDRAFQPLHQLG